MSVEATYPSTISIKQRPTNRTCEEEKERGDRSDPGNVIWRPILELMCHVVFQYDAKGIGIAQACEEDEGGSAHDEPGSQPAIWCW